MRATIGVHGRVSGATPPSLALASGGSWRREFSGEECQLRLLRQWLTTLLPPCPARDDVIMVANELGANAIMHSSSGLRGRFTVEITCFGTVVRVAVADGGAATGPTEVDNPGSEHGRGLAVVRELSVRRGSCGDHRGRLVWADVPVDGQAGGLAPAEEPAIRSGEAAPEQAWLSCRPPDLRCAMRPPAVIGTPPSARRRLGLRRWPAIPRRSARPVTAARSPGRTGPDA
jgi:hypothetical protein